MLAVLLPAQRPFRPHDVAAAVTHADIGSGSVPPAATAEQVPMAPAKRQDSQVPEQAALQHTPGLPSER